MPNPGSNKMISGKQVSKEKKTGGGGFWNFLTLLAILGIILVVVWFALVFRNPNSSVNPFPPPTLPAQIVLPTQTPTQPALPPTWTPVVTATEVPTFTPVPTKTATLSATEIVAKGPTPTATEAPVSLYVFDLDGTPAGFDASVLYPERDCQWLGVGGQVLDMKNHPVIGITVQIGGTLGTDVIDQTSLTGLALKYGDAGYEFDIARQPVATTQTMWVRLIDQARLPLSPKVIFDTYPECQRNLIIINFRQVR